MTRHRTQSATIVVIPNSERASISLRLPAWALPVVALLVLGALLLAGYFGERWVRTQAELTSLRQQTTLEASRLKETRYTVLDQQSEIETIGAESDEANRQMAAAVAAAKADLAEVDNLTNQVRALMVITTPTPAPESPAGPASLSVSDPLALAVPAGEQRGVSSRGPRPVVPTISESVVELAALRQSIPARVEVLKGILAQIDQKATEIGESERDSEQALDEALAVLNAAPHRPPVDVPFDISSPFGARSSDGVYEFHEGVDIAVWYGTEVHATQDGIVTFSGWNGQYGYMVQIQHAEGFATAYGHNSRLLVQVGDHVRTGDVIAVSGSTGRSSGPHVHYEMSYYGTKIDPLDYMEVPAGTTRY